MSTAEALNYSQVFLTISSTIPAIIPVRPGAAEYNHWR